MSSKGLPEAPSSSSASHVDAADAAHGSSEPPAPLLRRSSSERPCVKLTVRLIDTYKHINKVYYEARAKAKSLEESEGASRGGTYNGGFDDQHYDYIIQAEEVFNGRYILKHKIGKVRAFLPPTSLTLCYILASAPWTPHPPHPSTTTYPLPPPHTHPTPTAGLLWTSSLCLGPGDAV